MNRHISNPKDFTRHRKLTFYDVITLILCKSVKSLQLVLNEFISRACKNFTITASAFTQARQKLSYTAFIELNNDIVNLYYSEKEHQISTYKGYRLLGFDGSKINVPMNTENISEFGCKNVGNDCSKKIGTCVQTTYEVCYDILNNIAIDGILDKGSIYEATLAGKLLNSMEAKDIGIFDRAYGSYNLMAEMIKQNKHFVIRCQRSSFIEAQELYESNEPILSKVVTLRPAYKNLGKIKKTTLPDKVKVRLLKFTLSNNEPEVLVTSLIDENTFSIEDIKNIYGLRWGVKTFFGKLKGRLNIENFTGKNLNSIKQDIWSTIFLSNLETIMTEDIDCELKLNTSAKGIKQQKINKAISFNAIKAKAFDLFYHESNHEKIIEELAKLFLLNRHCVRSGRTAPRQKRSGYKKWSFHKYVKKRVF